MANVSQINVPTYNGSHYGPIHSFKVVDVGSKRVMINTGKFIQLGDGGAEIAIGGDLGEKMVEHLWKNHDASKAFTVAVGDFIFIRIVYEDPANTDVGANVEISEVRLEKNADATPGQYEKIIKIAKITEQKEVGDGFFVTKIDQLHKSDIYEIIVGTGLDSDSSAPCQYDASQTVTVIIGFETVVNGDCTTITPKVQTITFCGEQTASSNGTPFDVCCTCGSSSSAAPP